MPKPLIHRIREILHDHGRLAAVSHSLTGNDNLYDSGLTSHATIHVMLALEEAFDLEFPDELLSRGTFESIDNISAAIVQLDPSAAVS
ncbi:MAG: acyl carrier protein [Sphingomicrobium sp.]